MARAMTFSSPETRQAVAHLVAKFFLIHLQIEVTKPDAVLLEDFPELPVRQMTVDLIARVRHEFSIAEDETLPGENIFKQWCEANGRFEYEDAAFVGYNRIFLPRLLDLRDGTPESRETFHATMRSSFDRFDYERHGYTVAFFLESESNMRELMRQAVHKYLPGLGTEADGLVLGQSRGFQTAMYEYFEGVLKTTLAANVRLLHGILPQQVASELKRNGFVEPVFFQDAAVLFTDFERFSQFTAHLAPGEVIRRLDTYFTEFDRISAVHGLEKIKTIGGEIN